MDSGTTSAPVALINADMVVDAGALFNFRAGTAGSSSINGLMMGGQSTVTVNGTLNSQLTATSTTSGTRAGLIMYADSGQTNTFTVNTGASVTIGYSNIGNNATGVINATTGATNAVIIDGGTMWARAMNIGLRGNDNTVTVKNNGKLTISSSGASIGGASGQSGQGELIIGTVDEHGVASAGTVEVEATLYVGTGNQSGKGTITLNAGTFSMTAANSRTVVLGNAQNTSGTLNINGGTMNITRAQGDDTLTLAPNYTAGGTGKATVNLSGGTLNVDKFVSETAAGTINFTGGLFTVKQATVSNGKAFTVGDGSKAATLRLVTATGSGHHTFADGLVISAKAQLEGSGKIAAGLAGVHGALAAKGGTLEFAAGLTLFDGSTIDLNDASGSILISGGALTIADNATINLSLASFTEGDPITLFSVSGSVVKTDLSDVKFTLNGGAATGLWNGSSFQITGSVIPEPATIAAMFGAVVLLVACDRIRRKI